MKVRLPLVFLLTFMTASCAEGPSRMAQVSLAKIQNVHGYNERDGGFLQGNEVLVRRFAQNGAVGYVVAFDDAWVFVIGNPTENPYWYKSDDAAVRLELLRRTNEKHAVDLDAVIASYVEKNLTAFDVTPLLGHVSVEKSGKAYDVFLDVRSAAKIQRNPAWLKSLEARGDGLLAERMRALPGEMSEAVIKGPITSVSIFTGW